MNNTDLKIIYNKIKTSKNILILTHMNPDGDAIGSMIALKLIIEKLDIPVDAIVTNKLEFMEELSETKRLLTTTNKNYDLTILVDVNSKDRLGDLEYLYESATNLIILDHHKVNLPKEIIHYVDSNAPSATTIIYQLTKENDIEINSKIAKYLYLGLLTDTGGFAYNNTNSKTLSLAAKLLNYNLNHSEMYNSFITPEYDTNYLMLEKKTIENLEIINNKIAVSFLSHEDITKHPYGTPKDFVNLGRKIKDIEVSLMFIEEEPNKYKVSLRSKEYLDVSIIAKKFNGGGHKYASGIRFNKEYKKIKDQIILEINRLLEDS
ncbi:MAG: bifunctional oligoribonuclease/PAP phosphatase NrnA [Bacilli bacterium]|nr:bifunctional oligoribonuclease/PAP phosphatase NrnA [Bacilli bacterium]